MQDGGSKKAPLAGSNEQAETRGNAQQRTPSISLPKGGGALRSIDEKFSVNAANGTCDVTIPLPFSKTRSGLDSSLTLRYSSGSGNSPFGLGWGVTLPSIQRRTDKQLPRYEDAIESDVFLFSGAEDLVPAYTQDPNGNWVPDALVIGNRRVERYRPRIEGLFARIEKIAVTGETGFFWKVTTRENVVTIFGRTAAARIADPQNSNRIFRWLPEWSYDDKGNCVEFVYKNEDLQKVPDVVEEKNRRSGLAPLANKYLKEIHYGNTNPYYPDPAKPFDPPPPAKPGYMYEIVFDYGEHDTGAPSPDEVDFWPCRYDPFSDCRAGFEIRTYRLCRRILFFHFFAELDFAPDPYLVRSLDLTYKDFHFDNVAYKSQEVDYITSITPVHYLKTAPNAYQSKAWPSFDLSYQELAWNKAVQSVSPEDVLGAPAGASQGYQWLDLYEEGVPGILTEQASAWYYKNNLGDAHFSRAADVVPKPSLLGVAAGGLQFQDLNADGSRQVSLSEEPKGFFELSDENEWLPFRAFQRTLNVNFSDANTKFVDLNGDGKPDLLISEEYVFRWYPSLGTVGYEEAQFTAKAIDEERGPAVIFADGTETMFIADMNGDGLADIVRIRNGEVCYWPSLGYGKFGAKVTMRNAPHFDSPEHFDPTKIQLGDISGTGAADLIYLGRNGFCAWINLAGNAWSDVQEISPFPGTEFPNNVSVLDLLGNGTVCLVWSSELPANEHAPIRYVDLMGGKKPFIVSGYTNNLGKEIQLEYKSSTYYALLDKREGRPWATKLPFPTMCLSRVETRDTVSRTFFVQKYRYRHGYFDHAEREFRGFGMVEQTDTETFDNFQKTGANNVVDNTVYQPPVRTRTWFQTGAYLNGVGILSQFAKDYFQNTVVEELRLPDAVLEAASSPTPEESRQATRACKGMTLRQEVYADDSSPAAALPYSTAEHNCHIRMLQPMLGNRYAVFLVHESQAVTYHYERNPADPRIAHNLNTVIDELGDVVESASVVYGRLTADTTLPGEVQTEQGRIRVTYTVHSYTNDVETNDTYRLRLSCETQVFELNGAQPLQTFFAPDEIRSLFLGASPLRFEQQPHPGLIEKRLSRHERTLFVKNADVNNPLPLGSLESLGLAYENYRLAFTPTLLTALYAGKVTDAMLAEGKYIKSDDYKINFLFPPSDPSGYWWGRTGIVQYPANPSQHFYLPDRYLDSYGSTTTVHYYGNYHLLVDQTTDPLTNATSVLSFDFRFLQPTSVKDINDNITELSLDIFGLVVGMAVRGKGNEADDLNGFRPDLLQAQIDAFLGDPVANGPALLQNATSRFVYNFSSLPVVAASIVRETHTKAAQAAGTPSKLQYGFEYSNGLGRVAMKKFQAEPGKAKQCVVNPDGTYTITEIDTTPNLRWVGTGRTVLNNKGKTVMQYEPYFSVTPAYEDAPELVETGVTPIFYYDPIGRPSHTDYPDGTFSRAELDPWLQKTYDRNDNVLASAWYAARISGALGTAEQAAAQKTALHDSTPSVMHSDSLGRPICNIDDNKFRDRLTNAVREELYSTLFVLDISGNRLAVRDARQNYPMRYLYDMVDHPDKTTSMDAGDRWTLADTLGMPLYNWDAQGNRIHTLYDALHRPTQHELLNPANATIVYEKSEYGTDKTKNQNEKLITQYDRSGTVTHDLYDFKGNLLGHTRKFTNDYLNDIDWSNPGAIAFQPGSYTTQSAYDALNRVTSTQSPDSSVTSFTYSEAGILTGVSVAIGGAPSQSFIDRITHDAKGQRQRIDYGNGTSTTFDYDPLTFRVQRIHTFPTPGNPSLQDLKYTYDPIGNITQIRDDAQRTIFFNNQLISPQNDFLYDSVYRLIGATGREHIGQNAPVSEYDEFRTNPPNANDINALRNYLQQYEYDFSDNLSKMVHSSGSGPFTNQWTRTFSPNLFNNRLDSSQVGVLTETYSYDPRGTMNSIPGMPTMLWDFDDHLKEVDLLGGGIAHYTYDSFGNRVRKVVERQGGIKEERLYIGTVEIFTRTQGIATLLQRQTLHVMDGSRRVALVDSRTRGDDGTPLQLIRYQFSNHLGTAMLEMDDAANFVSYEEYYPFGSTSFQGLDASRQIPPKRYRYTGKERDEETGLYYHGARYYAPWLGRWTACDPHGIKGGLNLYEYAKDNPLAFSDPTGRLPNPQLMGFWEYGKQLLNRAALGRNVQLDHPIQVALRSAQRTAPTGTAFYSRAISKAEGELTVIVETGKGLFHTELGKLQAVIRQQTLAGVIRNESDLLEATRATYLQTANRVGATVNQLTLDTVLLSNQATVHVTTAQTVAELKALPSAATTVTATSIEQAFSEGAQVVSAAKIENVVATAASTLTRTESFLATAAKVAAPVAKVLRPLAPIARVAGRIATPLAIGTTAVQLATAKTTEQKVDAGISAVSTALLMSKNPVAMAGGAGLAAGQLIEKTLNVSEFASEHGIQAQEFAKRHGAGETTAFVIGAVVTIESTPVAIAEAAVAKVRSWF